MPKIKPFKTESPFLKIRKKLSLSLRDLAALTDIHYFKLYEFESGYKLEIPQSIIDKLLASKLIKSGEELKSSYSEFLKARLEELKEVCN